MDLLPSCPHKATHHERESGVPSEGRLALKYGLSGVRGFTVQGAPSLLTVQQVSLKSHWYSVFCTDFVLS